MIEKLQVHLIFCSSYGNTGRIIKILKHVSMYNGGMSLYCE